MNPKTNNRRSPASFRDPASFVFFHDGTLLRYLGPSYRRHYDRLMESGLYQALVNEGWLIAHREVNLTAPDLPAAYKILQPEFLPFISYPYEWAFAQLKDAALLVLKIQKKAMESGMTLKDASAYNVQWHRNKPVWIDTASFEVMEPGTAWIPYRQFCEHFLAPLALMSLVDVRMVHFLKIYLDGIPIDLASRLLPASSYLRPTLLFHIHLHAWFQRLFSGKKTAGPSNSKARMSRYGLFELIDQLEKAVQNLRWKPARSTWSDYYEKTNYSEESFKAKHEKIKEWILSKMPRSVWDLGANTGIFSRIAVDQGIPVIAFDSDPTVVNQLYSQSRDSLLSCYWVDLTNPSPSHGWAHEERESLVERGPVDLVMALALIHHLAIAHNVPLERIAEFMSRIARTLIMEFVPKTDSQVETLLMNRPDIFDDYHEKEFEDAFTSYFEIRERFPIPGSKRILYLLDRRQ